MKLMKDTCSLVNYLIENDNNEIHSGDTFAELMWSDRNLWQVVGIRDDKTIAVKRVKTFMRDWAEGTEYPCMNESGYELMGDVHILSKARKYWKIDGHRVHLSWGATTGYRDPSF